MGRRLVNKTHALSNVRLRREGHQAAHMVANRGQSRSFVPRSIFAQKFSEGWR
jgi:hypothetical protein